MIKANDDGPLAQEDRQRNLAEALGVSDTPTRADMRPVPPEDGNEGAESQTHRTFTVGGQTYTDFAEALRAQFVRLRDFFRGCGITDAELAQLPEPQIPPNATPETLNPESRWPVSQALDRMFENRFPLLSTADLNSATHEPRYLIPGILAAGQLGGIFGPSKTLKTSIAADLLISLASGTPFLGRFAVAEPGKVLLLAEQSGLAALQSMARRICAGRGLSLESLANLKLSTSVPKLDDGVEMMALKELIAREKPVCVVIDPSFLAMAGRRSGGKVPRGLVGITRILEPLVELCRSSGCAVLFVHQSRPPRSAGHPATLDDAAGSGFAELAQQWLFVSRRRSFDPGSGRHELWLTTGNRVGASALWELDVDEGVWKTELRPVVSAGVLLDEQHVATRQDAQARRCELAFLRQCRRAHDLLAAHPGGMSARRMRDMLGMSGERITRVLDWLLENGLMKFGTLGGSRATDKYSWAAPWPDLAIRGRGRGTVPPPGAGRGNAPAPGAAGAERNGVLPPAADQSAPESVGRDTSAEAGRDTCAGHQTDDNKEEPSPQPSPSGPGEGEETGRDTGAKMGRDTGEANGGTDQPTAEE